MKNIIVKYNKLAVCLLLVAVSLICTFTVFGNVFGDTAKTASELFTSFMSYIYFLFFLRLPTQSPVQAPTGEIEQVLPTTPEQLLTDGNTFWQQLFDGQNFANYMHGVENFLVIFCRVMPLVIMLLYLVRRYIKNQFTKQNNKYNKDTMPLCAFKKVSSALYVPPKKYLASLLDYIKQSKFTKILLCIWFFNFNGLAVIMSVLSICLYFFISFDFVALYHFFYNSIVLLLPMFRFIPAWLWLVFLLVFIDRKRKQKALDRLRYMESQNKEFIQSLSICSMLVGTMGKGKTTLVTDISLSCEAIFRSKAKELMLDIDLKFPHFPYIILENEIKAEIDKGTIFNLASCSAWIEKCEKEFKTTNKIWQYDHKKYGLTYDDKKTTTSLFKALKDYAKLYMIYITTSSLILSNYAIRTDFCIFDNGNLPLWNLDFFDKDSRHLKDNSKNSHILDFDMLRLGKKVIENNRFANSFEFGVIAITETGKERGNQYKTQEIKDTVKNLRDTIRELEKAKADSTIQRAELLRLTDQATQLTDKFNESLKLIRHKCTVCGFPFARVFLDEQRPESLGADARDLCEIVHIREKSETKLAMPFFFIGELLHDFIFPKFKNAYESFRFNRGDNSLIMFSLKKLGATIYSAYTRTYNRFGYHIRSLAVEDSASGTITKENRYFVSTKKIYSNRFSTDAYGDIFANGLRQCSVGLNDIPEYKTSKASEEELKSQNSYFINEITKYGTKKTFED